MTNTRPRGLRIWYNITNRTVSKQTETTLNFHIENKICSLSNCFGWSSENNGFGIEAKQPKQIISKQTKTNQNKPEKP
jgi:hypothetical protein